MLDGAGRYDEAHPLWDNIIMRWPEVEFILIDALAGAANSGNWARFSELVDVARTRGFRSRPFNEIRVFYENLRRPDPAFKTQFLSLAQGALETTGTVRLDFIYGLHATGSREEAFDIIDRVSFAHVFDRDGPPVAGGVGETTPAIIFAEPNFPMMRDIRFVQLCAKLGLCDYWVKSNTWPDCAERVSDC